jgi:hypothetical protein
VENRHFGYNIKLPHPLSFLWRNFAIFDLKKGKFWDYFSKCKFDYFLYFKKNCQYFDLKKYEKKKMLAINHPQ